MGRREGEREGDKGEGGRRGREGEVGEGRERKGNGEGEEGETYGKQWGIGTNTFEK